MEQKVYNDSLSRVMDWGTQSKAKEVCGIFGCTNQPLTTHCKHCGNWYCGEHAPVIDNKAAHPDQ